MNERWRFARRRSPALHAYELQPVCSRARRLGRALVWVLVGTAAGAGLAGRLDPRASAPGPCVTPSHDVLVAELTETRLRLARERSARAALEQAAREGQDEAARLKKELLFLRTQRDGRP